MDELLAGGFGKRKQKRPTVAVAKERRNQQSGTRNKFMNDFSSEIARSRANRVADVDRKAKMQQDSFQVDVEDIIVPELVVPSLVGLVPCPTLDGSRATGAMTACNLSKSALHTAFGAHLVQHDIPQCTSVFRISRHLPPESGLTKPIHTILSMPDSRILVGRESEKVELYKIPEEAESRHKPWELVCSSREGNPDLLFHKNPGHISSVTRAVVMTPTDSIMTSSLDSTVRLWDPTLRSSQLCMAPEKAQVTALAGSNSVATFLTRTDRVCRWDCRAGAQPSVDLPLAGAVDIASAGEVSLFVRHSGTIALHDFRNLTHAVTTASVGRLPREHLQRDIPRPVIATTDDGMHAYTMTESGVALAAADGKLLKSWDIRAHLPHPDVTVTPTCIGSMDTDAVVGLSDGTAFVVHSDTGIGRAFATKGRVDDSSLYVRRDAVNVDDSEGRRRMHLEDPRKTDPAYHVVEGPDSKISTKRWVS
ncbi:Trp-Asp (WD) repeats circular [Carpediemonas membranifera]|uniref:Trp-Asp (WD) repeats circular n=1 Tax=Carpediemonas membranifera TaxID=201153 RepID=A0A8J6APM8_9EUKA|nr:Trp-Asp (WD) repeats circular [Carpediemonas membranifera]|eukprot:KAG9389668.1 Trp-Asp (WD) repeats circular [Carpediemonas membranifera]